MKRTPKLLATHVRESNHLMWSRFLQIARDQGITNSVALERAARTWLRELGEWEFILADPAPDRLRKIEPIAPGDFEPFFVPVEVAPYVDRWKSPPMIVIDGLPDVPVPGMATETDA